ncbi:MAG: vWA domain-containing protein [Spirochaetaceae bacterium]
MWVFEAPLFLLLLAVVPPAIWFRHIWHGRGSRVPLPIATVPRHCYRSPFHLSNLLQFFSGVLFWLALIVVILALAGPARVTRERVYLTRGMDIMVVLDESPSMAAEDFRPYNRFETAQRVIRSFAESRENDAIGLVTFAGEAALRVPRPWTIRSCCVRWKSCALWSSETERPSAWESPWRGSIFPGARLRKR